MKKDPRSLSDWLHNPTQEETICSNYFHSVMVKVDTGYDEWNSMNPDIPDANHPYTKLARLIKADLVIPDGSAIYVRDGSDLYTLGDALDLLAYYMHVDTKEAGKAAAVLEQNFQGFFPITANKVWHDGITLLFEDGSYRHINLKTMEEVKTISGYPEFGQSLVKADHFNPLVKYFSIINRELDDPWFCEKMLMYPFNQRIREKSHVLVGEGGNGKGILMQMVKRMYGMRAATDAPQPTFTGHSAAKIAYNFIGKRVVTFNDVGKPNEDMLEWLKGMITGNLHVKTPTDNWLSVPCVSNFIMETNHRPQILDMAAHKRRYVIREFPKEFKLADVMSEEELDVVGDRGEITSGDIVNYIMCIKEYVDDWINFEYREIKQEQQEAGPF